MKIFHTPECLSYRIPGHPESPDRVRLIACYLRDRGYDFVEPEACTEADVLHAHSPAHLDRVRHETFLDGDTPPFPGILSLAMRSAGGAIQAARHSREGGHAFSLMRPPGHHADRDTVMGFCYLNNMAIAVGTMLHERPGLKAAVLDIDCHHGNGSETILARRENVLFISLHQSPLYPGTGLTSYDNIHNYPLPPLTGGGLYLKTLMKACDTIAAFGPDILGISAGFDTFQEDPLTAMQIDVDDYSRIGTAIAALEIPAFSVLEGGYHQKLGECVDAFLRPFGGPE